MTTTCGQSLPNRSKRISRSNWKSRTSAQKSLKRSTRSRAQTQRIQNQHSLKFWSIGDASCENSSSDGMEGLNEGGPSSVPRLGCAFNVHVACFQDICFESR